MRIEFISYEGGMGVIAKAVTSPFTNMVGTGEDLAEAMLDLRLKTMCDSAADSVELVDVNHRRF